MPEILLILFIIGALLGISAMILITIGEVRAMNHASEVADGLVASLKPYARTIGRAKRRILVVGDSTAYGVGASSPEASLVGRLGAHYADAEIINLGQNRAVIADALKQLKLVSKQKFNLVILLVGGNDVTHFTPREELHKNTQRLYRRARKLSPNVIHIPTGDVGRAPVLPRVTRPAFSWRSKVAREIFLSLAPKNGIVLVDLYKIESKVPIDETFYAVDFFHPSDIGYAAWFEIIKPYLPRL